MALDYQGGYQPNMHFELIQNTVHDATGGLGILIDGNPANMSLSHGHVVRDNVVTAKVASPSPWTTFDAAIAVGVDSASSSCSCRLPPERGGGCCFGSVERAVSDVVVEDNAITVGLLGNCSINGVSVFALHSVSRGNTCQ